MNKRCPSCGRDLPVTSEYWWFRKGKPHSWCKVCITGYSNRWTARYNASFRPAAIANKQRDLTIIQQFRASLKD